MRLSGGRDGRAARLQTLSLSSLLSFCVPHLRSGCASCFTRLLRDLFCSFLPPFPRRKMCKKIAGFTQTAERHLSFCDPSTRRQSEERGAAVIVVVVVVFFCSAVLSLIVFHRVCLSCLCAYVCSVLQRSVKRQRHFIADCSCCCLRFLLPSCANLVADICPAYSFLSVIRIVN